MFDSFSNPYGALPGKLQQMGGQGMYQPQGYGMPGMRGLGQGGMPQGPGSMLPPQQQYTMPNQMMQQASMRGGMMSSMQMGYKPRMTPGDMQSGVRPGERPRDPMSANLYAPNAVEMARRQGPPQMSGMAPGQAMDPRNAALNVYS